MATKNFEHLLIWELRDVGKVEGEELVSSGPLSNRKWTFVQSKISSFNFQNLKLIITSFHQISGLFARLKKILLVSISFLGKAFQNLSFKLTEQLLMLLRYLL